ncbi:Peroxiredoxin-2 [Podochytrium sp. JEL0797]|nr:Peroxiredoxin-2 [Podochytrium sp. JEL0797]
MHSHILVSAARSSVVKSMSNSNTQNTQQAAITDSTTTAPTASIESYVLKSTCLWPDCSVGNLPSQISISDIGALPSEKTPCSLPTCPTVEKIVSLCPGCNQNFCLAHRHAVDHTCPSIPQQAVQAQEKKEAIQNLVNSKLGIKKDSGIAKESAAAKPAAPIVAKKKINYKIELMKLKQSAKDWPVGKLVDKIAVIGKVANFNNVGDSADKKLALFDWETRQELPMNESLSFLIAEGKLQQAGSVALERMTQTKRKAQDEPEKKQKIEHAAPVSEIARIGHPAPQFSTAAVLNQEFKDIKLSDYKGKWVVLFFYPLDFTFVCPTEIIAYSEAAEEFRKINTEIIGCSIDSKFSHLAWIKQARENGGLGEMKIPLLADVTKSIAKSYGVLKEDEGIAYRGTFIIDPKQNVRQITINDLDIGRSIEEVKRLVDAFQFHELHGDVCPMNWKKGAKSMVADVNKSKEYFAAVNKK